MKSRKSCVKHAKVAVRVALLSGFAALTVQIPLASAADYGVGVLFSGQGSTVLAPVRLESLTVEPELSFFRTSSNQETFHVVTLSTGIYVRKDLGQSFESYVGEESATADRKIDSISEPALRTPLRTPGC